MSNVNLASTRASSVHAIMTKPRSKSEYFSETAKTAMIERAREILFGVRKDLSDNKYIKKGNGCEDAAIHLYNQVFMTDLKKVDSSQRRDNGIITGEPDLIATHDDKGTDIKNAYSIATFPLFPEQAAKKEYEWQARAYMCLFDLDYWEIAYCFIDTPEELRKPWEPESHHVMDTAVPLHHRITVAGFERDMELEQQMLERCTKANAWVHQRVQLFSEIHEKYIN